MRFILIVCLAVICVPVSTYMAHSQPVPRAPVRVFAQLFAKGGDQRLVRDFVVVDNGVDIAIIRYAGGSEVMPGTYTLEVRDVFTPFRLENVVIGFDKNQTLAYEIPVGWLQIKFQFKTPPTTNSRIAQITKLDEAGTPSAQHMDIMQGQTTALTAGHYQIKVRFPKGDFTPVQFTIVTEETKTIELAEN